MWLFSEFVKNVINAWYIRSITVAFMADKEGESCHEKL